jgi:AraC-like DNA-binding protein
VNDADEVGDVSAVFPAKPDVADRRAEARAIARGLTMLLQIISSLRPVGCGHHDDLADRSCGCARAIAVPVERLLLTSGPPPIARGLQVLAALASDAGLSRFHLCRGFKESIVLSPHTWLRQHRFEQAMDLVWDTGLSVVSVAAALGYASQTAFTAAFRKLTGET